MFNPPNEKRSLLCNAKSLQCHLWRQRSWMQRCLASIAAPWLCLDCFLATFFVEILGSDNDVPIATIVIAVVASGIPAARSWLFAFRKPQPHLRKTREIFWAVNRLIDQRCACTATKERGQVADQSSHHLAPFHRKPWSQWPQTTDIHTLHSTGFPWFHASENQTGWTATIESATTKSRKPPSGLLTISKRNGSSMAWNVNLISWDEHQPT